MKKKMKRAKTPALILLHGFLGNRGAFRHLAARFAPRVRAIALDLPGRGDSPLPAHRSRGRRGFDEALALIEGMIGARVRSQAVDLLGYSQGARVALALALRGNIRVRRLVLESGSPGLASARQRAARRAKDARLAKRIEALGVHAFVRRWEAVPVLETLLDLPPETARALRRRRQSAKPAGLAGALRCLGSGVQPSYWTRLAGLDVPVLLVTGALDAKFTAIARRMRRRLPRAQHCILAHAGHAPHLEVPDEYAAVVLSFLTRR